jgi:hypothetical protein
MNSSCYRRMAWVALALFGLPAAAAAQGMPQQPGASGNPVCVRLEGQLASIDRAGADPARAEQARRIDESLSNPTSIASSRNTSGSAASRPPCSPFS